MTLKLKIISEHRAIVGDDAVREFSDEGGSIGRSLRNDWILPDADRYISGRHAVIDFRGGMYYIADLSTNGVYLNDEDEPIGRGNPRRLYGGDRLRMGDFEIAVSVDEGESLAIPLDDEATVIPNNVEQLVPEDLPDSGNHMIDAEEMTGDDAFRSALLGPSLAATSTSTSTSTSNSIKRSFKKVDSEPSAKAPEAKAPEAKAPEAKTPPQNKKSRAIKPKRVEITADDLLDTFLDGVGISRADLHPSVDPAEVMQNAGEVMKEFVMGMTRLLVSRTNLKTAFSLDKTTILPQNNNPLKLSRNTTDSIKQLLVGRPGEYLGPRDSVHEVCRDLFFHQDAFLNAMSAAFIEFANRFDPAELAATFEHGSESKPMFGFMNKQKYWQMYCDAYPLMTEKGDGRFPHAFSEEFVKCYERQIAEFERQAQSDSPVQIPMLEPASNDALEEQLKQTVSYSRNREFETQKPPKGRASG